MVKIIKMTDQAYCPWCGGDLTWKSDNKSAICRKCNRNIFPNPRPTVSLILINNDRILFLRRTIQPKQGYLDLLGGFIDLTDNSAESAALREAEEETGLNLKIGNLNYICTTMGRDYAYQGVNIESLNIYFFTDITDQQVNSIKLNTENSEVVWLDAAESLNENLAFEIHKKAIKQYIIVHDNKKEV